MTIKGRGRGRLRGRGRGRGRVCACGKLEDKTNDDKATSLSEATQRETQRARGFKNEFIGKTTIIQYT